MQLINKRPLSLQDTDLRLVSNNNNETSLHIPKPLAESLQLENNAQFEFEVEKLNFLEALTFPLRFKKPLYKKSDLWKIDEDWFSENYHRLNAFFGSEKTKKYTVKVNIDDKKRHYLIGIKQSDSNFNIRNFLIDSHSTLVFYKKNDNSILLKIENSETLNTESLKIDDNVKKNKIHELNQILFGAAGTGKSHNTINHAIAIVENKTINAINSIDRNEIKIKYDTYIQNGQIDFVTFHQSYSYEEFIEGIKPEITEGGGVTYHVQDGTFKKMCQVAESNPEKDFVFIIDEINRGNISKIFGELITLIEDSKRIGQAEALQIKLAYSGSGDNPKLFGVPQNLYIIGTMNTADRSIALLDTALRRRFKFIEYRPKPELLSNDFEGINLQTLLTTINQRLELLLDKDHAIGHAYFLKVETKNDLCKVFKNNIIPQLEEFFYNDYDKIQLVLGDNDKWKGNNDDLKLILKTGKVSSNAVFGEDLDILEGKAIYEMNDNLKEDNFDDIKSEVFISIYQKP